MKNLIIFDRNFVFSKNYSNLLLAVAGSDENFGSTYVWIANGLHRQNATGNCARRDQIRKISIDFRVFD